MARPGCEGPPKMGTRIWGFGRRPNHCVEEDILKQRMGN